MNISISQNFKNVLKNKIKILISPILYKSIDFIIDNLFEINNPDKYFYFINTWVWQFWNKKIFESIINAYFFCQIFIFALRDLSWYDIIIKTNERLDTNEIKSK